MLVERRDAHRVDGEGKSKRVTSNQTKKASTSDEKKTIQSKD